MRFSCPTCNQVIQVAEEATGQTIACPTCRQRLKVPGAAARPATIDKTVLGKTEPEAPHVTERPRSAPIPETPAPRRRDKGDPSWDERDDRPRRRRDAHDDDYDDAPRRPPVNVGLAIAALVCGIVGIIFSWCVFVGPICGLLGIIFGGIHLSHKVKEGNGMAISGLTTGALGIVFFIIFIIIAISSNQPFGIRRW